MHWLLSTPFIKNTNSDKWLQPFVPGTNHTFETIPATYDHDRSRKQTNASQWIDYFKHGSTTWKASKQSTKHTGIITSFPQLAIAVGLHKKLSLRKTPLLAWTFNLGGIYKGPKKVLSQFALSKVDKFIVHSKHEITSYSEWLDLPPDKFLFVPLQRPVKPIVHREEQIKPFVLSMGTARRDYKLFLEVMSELKYPTIIVASKHSISNLRIPNNVTILSNLSIHQCHELVQKARINVVPIDNSTTASGQVTLIESMMYARPTVATRTIGTVDYAENEKTALLVPENDHNSMKFAIQSLWEDKHKREKIGVAARKYVEEHLSDSAAGETLLQVLNNIEKQL